MQLKGFARRSFSKGAAFYAKTLRVMTFAPLLRRKSHRTAEKTFILAMKLTAIILFAACLHVSANGFSQTVSLSVKNAPLEKVFLEIRRQTGLEFVYNTQMLSTARKVDLDIKNAALEQVLYLCFENQPFTYTIVDKVIIVKQKEEGRKELLPPGDLHGLIMNERREPLSGANIIIKRTGKGTITNARGEFTLHNLMAGDEVVISYIGYQTISAKPGDQDEITLIMKTATNELDKVVVQAYGKTTQRLATGNIGTVTAAEIERQPVMNPLLALQGKIAGLDVNQTSGYASAPIKVELRGRNAISDQFTSDPLYIIDGVPLTVLEIGGNSNYTRGSSGFVQAKIGGPANGQSPFFSINPSDIESIEVLKDADATAIYGSRAANGVILITTKKGKAGKTNFDLHISTGIQKVTKFWHMMNTSQYLAMRREAYKNDGFTPSLANGGYDLLQWDTTRYIDWQRVLFGGTGKNIDVESSISGGDARTTFRIGAGYTHATNILTVSGADQRGSLSLSLGHHSLNQRFSISATSGYSFAQSDMIGLPSNAVLLPPNAPDIYDSAGNLNYAGWGGTNSSARNKYAFASLKAPYTSNTNFLNSSLGFGYEPLRGLKISANLGYNNALALQKLFTLIASKDPLRNPTGSAEFGNSRNTNWIVEPQFTYDAVLGKGKLSVLAGGSIQKGTTSGTNIYGNGYTSDDLIRTISNAPEKFTDDLYGEYKYAAIFGRINYNWENKYILNLNMRRDGSSRFGAGRQFGNFGSIAAVWIFTAENWFPESLKFLSFGKIRSSYGTTGSDAVGDYGYLTRWSSNDFVPYEGFQPLAPTQHANPNFHWQVNKKLEAAIDLGFVRDRIHISVAYYRNRTGDQLIPFPTPQLSGFESVTANSPALVQNEGWEFQGNTAIISTKNFNWSINFNTGINRNKLVAYPNIAQSPYANTLVVGRPLNITQKLHYIGVNPQTGRYSFEDKNHDGQIMLNPSQSTNDGYPYDLSPKFIGGLGMNFSYKSLQCNLFFNIKKQVGRNAYNLNGSNSPGGLFNQPVEIIGKEWKAPGDRAAISRFSTLFDNDYSGLSDLIYTDASYIRLSNLSIAYSLPASYVKKIGMQSCSLFFHTNNLFIITKYKGLDPETQNFGGMPPSKILAGGISFNF